jgi:hypothetical protein
MIRSGFQCRSTAGTRLERPKKKRKKEEKKRKEKRECVGWSGVIKN